MPSVMRRQRFSRPSRHITHRSRNPLGSQLRTGLTTTLCPRGMSPAREPFSTTVPTFSWPITNSSEEKAERAGLVCRVITPRSLPQMPP